MKVEGYICSQVSFSILSVGSAFTRMNNMFIKGTTHSINLESGAVLNNESLAGLMVTPVSNAKVVLS